MMSRTIRLPIESETVFTGSFEPDTKLAQRQAKQGNKDCDRKHWPSGNYCSIESNMTIICVLSGIST